MKLIKFLVYTIAPIVIMLVFMLHTVVYRIEDISFGGLCAVALFMLVFGFSCFVIGSCLWDKDVNENYYSEEL